MGLFWCRLKFKAHLSYVSSSSHIDKPFLRLFKSCNDIGIIVNTKDENLYTFRNGYPKYYGKIEKFEYDSKGRMYIESTFTFKRHVGDVSIPGKIWFNYGNDFFITLIDGKKKKHDLFNFEFKNKSVF